MTTTAFFIPINRDTFRPNPDYTASQQPKAVPTGPKQCELTLFTTSEKLILVSTGEFTVRDGKVEGEFACTFKSLTIDSTQTRYQRRWCSVREFLCTLKSLITRRKQCFSDIDVGDTIEITSDTYKRPSGVKEWSIDIEQKYDWYVIGFEPRWLFSYAPARVTCRECHAEFDHSELESDCMFDGEDEQFSNAICPECGEWNCCDLQYESPDDVAQELGLIEDAANVIK